MIRLGDQIRLTGKDQKIWQSLNGGEPLNASTVAEFNRFLERCKTQYPGDTPDERFARSTLDSHRLTG